MLTVSLHCTIFKAPVCSYRLVWTTVALLVQVSDETRYMMRHDDKHSGITNIRHNDGVDRWLVVRRKLTKAKEVPSMKQLPKATNNYNYKINNWP